MKLYLFDAAGKCFARIEPSASIDSAEIAERNSAVAHVLDDRTIDIDKARLVDGVLVLVMPTPRVLDYREQRFLAYPAIGDQIDALWHAMAAGDLPMINSFFDPIAAVKAAHPKE